MLKCLAIFALLIGVAICAHVIVSHSSRQQLRMIEQSMNASIDPCANFYTYACSNWAKNYATRDYTEMMSMVDHNMNFKLKELLANEDNFSQVAGNSALDKMKIYYNSCLKRNIADLLSYFNFFKPGPGLEWPLLQVRDAGDDGNVSWLSSSFDVFKLLGEMNSYDFNNVLIRVGFYRTPSGVLQIYLHLPDVNDGEPITEQDIVAVMLYLAFPHEIAIKYAAEFLKTDTYWKNTYEKYVDSENQETLTYAMLKHRHPELSTFLENMLPGKIYNADEVIITNADYYMFLVQLFLQPAKSQELANYLLLRFLSYAGENAQVDCMVDIRQKMDMVVNYMYYLHSYLPESEQFNAELTTITEQIYRYLMDILGENRMGLSSVQLTQLMEKISYMKINMGNLPENVDEPQINAYFADVAAMDAGDYYKNQLNLLKHRLHTRLLCYQNQTHSLEYYDSTGYDVDVNMVIIPFAYLQEPMFSLAYDNLFVWSMFGYVLSHEYSHAVDNSGLLHDRDGLETSVFSDILKNPKFTATLECIQGQQQTEYVDERIADTLGVHVAFRAYLNENRMHLQPAFTTIPWDQLFFLNVAQFYCGNDDNDAGILQQIVANSADFAEAFACPVESNMNPEKKCRLY